MNLYKVWYQLPISETEDTFYYPPAWSAAHIYAETLSDAESQVNSLVEEHQEKLEEIGFVLRNIEQEKLRDISTALIEMME